MGDMTETHPDPATAALRAMLADQFQRIADGVASLADTSPAVAVWRPDPDANTIAWLAWHIGRVADAQLADLAGREQVWLSGGFADRFALPFDHAASGYGHSSADVAAVRTPMADLAAYQRAVHEACLDYASRLTADEAARIVDTRWDPPVTAAARLVSILGDCLQHLGQAAYVRGLAERAGVR